MQTQCMEESRQAFHEYQNTNSQNGPSPKNGPQNDASIPVASFQAIFQDHVPQYFSQF